MNLGLRNREKDDSRKDANRSEINRRFTQIYADKDSEISPQRRRGQKFLPNCETKIGQNLKASTENMFLFFVVSRQTKNEIPCALCGVCLFCIVLSEVLYGHFSSTDMPPKSIASSRPICLPRNLMRTPFEFVSSQTLTPPATAIAACPAV